jgi:Lipocalin-like domain
MTTTAFIGTWRLVSQHTHAADGSRTPSRGDGALGLLMYDAFGNMAVQLLRTDELRDRFTDLRSLETAMEGYLGYFGTYEVDAASLIVTHRVYGASFFGYRRSLQRRIYAFSEGDSILTLTAAVPKDGSTRVLVWQRVTGREVYD